MQNNALDAINPTIKTKEKEADSPVPYNQNEAKNKLKDVILSKLSLKVTVDNIKYNDLKKFFNHESGGKYYLKAEYHNNDDAIAEYLNNNKNVFSFLFN